MKECIMDGSLSFPENHLSGFTPMGVQPDASFSGAPRVAVKLGATQKLPQSFHVPQKVALILLPLGEPIEIETGDKRFSCAPGASILLGTGNYRLVSSRTEVHVLRIFFQRSAVQILAGRRFGSPRRFINLGRVLAFGSMEDDYGRILTGLVQPGSELQTLHEPEALLEALIDRLVNDLGVDAVFPLNRPVHQAMAFIRARQGMGCEAGLIEDVSGVSLATLRRGFKESLGVSLRQFTGAARLDWAHERLNRVDESRSIAELGIICGFKNGSGFSKSYMNRFGESPVETRKRTILG